MKINAADILRIKTTQQELVTAVENLVSWAERLAVTKQDLHEALGQRDAEALNATLKDDTPFEDMARELVADGLPELNATAIACLLSEVQREADLRGLLDDCGNLRDVPAVVAWLSLPVLRAPRSRRLSLDHGYDLP